MNIKNQSFTLSLEDAFFEKQQKRVQIDPSILIFWKSVRELFLFHILCNSFQEKCFSCYILLTDQISLSDYLYFLRYWAIWCIAIVCFPGCDVISFEINLIFSIKPFFYIAKNLRQNFKYLRAKRAFKVK